MTNACDKKLKEIYLAWLTVSRVSFSTWLLSPGAFRPALGSTPQEKLVSELEPFTSWQLGKRREWGWDPISLSRACSQLPHASQ